MEKSGEVRSLTDALQNTMDEIEALILSSNGAWQGDAEKAFSARIIYVKEQFSVISSFFDDYAGLLKSFAEGYDRLEADLVLKINQA